MSQAMEKDLKVQLLQEMEGHPAWKLFQDHLEALCKLKDREKAAALRRKDLDDAYGFQKEIDGIILAGKSLNNLISSLSQKAETPE